MKILKLLFVIIVLMATACVPQSQYNQEVQQNQQLQYLNGTHQQLNQSPQSEVAANQVTIRQLQNRLEVTMTNAILYPEGGWELSQRGQQELNKVIPALQGVPGKQIMIEGYTDDLPILPPLSERFPNNWALSAARAISVVAYLANQSFDPNQLSAVAFGKYHPIASNDTPEGRAQNRRINITLQDQAPERERRALTHGDKKRPGEHFALHHPRIFRRFGANLSGNAANCWQSPSHSTFYLLRRRTHKLLMASHLIRSTKT
jgi:chemotaxis protein MotB